MLAQLPQQCSACVYLSFLHAYSSHLSLFFGGCHASAAVIWCVIMAARRPIDLLVQLAATLWCRPGFSVHPLRVLRIKNRQCGACLYSNRQCNVVYNAVQCKAAVAVHACVGRAQSSSRCLYLHPSSTPGCVDLIVGLCSPCSTVTRAQQSAGVPVPCLLQEANACPQCHVTLESTSRLYHACAAGQKKQ